MAKASDETERRNERDRGTLADPDIRGSRRGRLGKGDDERYPNANTPERLERAWKREGK